MKKQKTTKVNNIKREIHTIDATGKVLGRLATEIAVLLRGKKKPGFLLRKDMGDKIVVVNADKIKITGRKIEQKKYYHHTGYLGGLKAESLKDIFSKNPGEVIKRAVFGMLPKNKLRDKWMKRLKFE